MSNRLEGRVAVVTGAGQRVGRGIARRLPLEGTTVVSKSTGKAVRSRRRVQ
jgi:NAD(P)-dependent dehydrogenase (short-subunit alcohol dehydrogenase family)